MESTNDAPSETPGQPLVWAFAAACGGIAVDALGILSLAMWIGVGLAAATAWLATRRLQFPISGWLVLIAVAALAGGRHQFYWDYYPPDALAWSATESGAAAKVEVIAETFPRRIPPPPSSPLETFARGERSRLRVTAVRIWNTGRWRSVSGSASVLVEGQLLGIAPGDRLEIQGTLLRPEAPRNPGEVDRRRQARAEGELCLIHCRWPDQVRLVAAGDSWRPAHILERLRLQLRESLARRLSEERQPLAEALLLGDRTRLESARVDAFRESGVMHLLAISGLHVGILAMWLFLLARSGLAPTRAVLFVVAVGTVVYALITDARPPVVRATILVLMACLGWWIGRRSISLNTLAAAGLVVLAINPTDLFAVGPQLSFLAVATLMAVVPRLPPLEPEDPLDRLIWRSRPWYVRLTRSLGHWIGQLLLSGGAVWLVTAPLVADRFHLLAPVALLWNVLLLLPVAAALLSGFGLLLLDWLAWPLAVPLAWVCEQSLWLLEQGAEYGRAIPGSHWRVPELHEGWIGGYYAGLGVWLLARPWIAARWLAAAVAIWWIVGAGILFWPRHDPQATTITAIAVGHGNCVLVELPDGRAVLSDAGALGPPRQTVETISRVLWSRGITRLDAIFLSHADVDHYNAAPGICRRFPVGGVYVGPEMFREDSAALAALRDALAEQAVPTRILAAGDVLRYGPRTMIRVLHPRRGPAIGSDNANSLVLRVEHAGHHCLLPGDLESPGLEWVLTTTSPPCAVALAPHHGSVNSQPDLFAKWCRAETLIISSGQPSSPRFQALMGRPPPRIRNTYDEGAIQARLTRSGVVVRGWREDPW